MLFKEGIVPIQTRYVSGGIPIMTSWHHGSPQKPAMSNTLDSPTSRGDLQVPLAGGGSNVFDTTGFCGDVMIVLPPLT